MAPNGDLAPAGYVRVDFGYMRISGGDGPLIGYARVSTRAQHDESQLADLAAAGCARIFTDKGVSGKLAARPALDECLAFLQPGQTLVITRLARAMRSIRHLLNTAHDLAERDIGLRVLKQDIDTTTPTGRLLFNVLASIAEFERELIVEGTLEGLAVAREKGHKSGPKPKLSPARVAHAREMMAERVPDERALAVLGTSAEAAAAAGIDVPTRPKHTATQVAAMLNVSPATVYRALDLPPGTRGKRKTGQPAGTEPAETGDRQ
jgi:DNA invertase Pin-like site-specific DNA recombinase